MCDNVLVLVESCLLTTKASSSGSHRGHGKAEETDERERRAAVTCAAFMVAVWLLGTSQ